jgi:hypothetical protein
MFILSLDAILSDHFLAPQTAVSPSDRTCGFRGTAIPGCADLSKVNPDAF